MRPIHLADIEIAARVLMRVAPDVRQQAIENIITQTEIADQFQLQHRTPHLQFGCGTLMSCARRLDAGPRPKHLGIDALDAYATVIAGLMAHLSHQKS